MGFIEKAYAVCGDIAKCPMCCSMWGTLVVLLLSGHDFMEAVALSFNRRIFIQLVRIAACVAFDKIRCNMAKSKPEPPKQGQEQNTPAGTKITRPRITRTIYKPIPRFNSGCHNC